MDKIIYQSFVAAGNQSDSSTVDVKRIDLIHPEMGGNKWFKLKYNIEDAKRRLEHTLLTFGGPYSNHIYATAAAGRLHGFKTIGVIRGEDFDKSTRSELTPTLQFAEKAGMQLEFISRSAYAEKDTEDFKAWLHDTYGAFYLIPEGGSNYLGVNGCMEILSEEDKMKYDVVICPCGTAATLAGIVLSLGESQRAIGFSALKGGEFLVGETLKHLKYFLMHDLAAEELAVRFTIATDYHFGGYGKWTKELLSFISITEQTFDIPLDQVYTGKMMFGIADMINKGIISSDERVLAIHTGGLQGRSPEISAS